MKTLVGLRDSIRAVVLRTCVRNSIGAIALYCRGTLDDVATDTNGRPLSNDDVTMTWRPVLVVGDQ